MSCNNQTLILPGQTIEASASLRQARDEVEQLIGKSIVFLDIKTHPNPLFRNARGHQNSDGGKECIWLDPAIPYHEQEGVAAHELAHVVQKAEGYCQIATKRYEDGRAVIPTISFLGTTINSTIQDAMADSWADNRGFRVADGLKANALPRALADTKLNPDEQEYTNWEEYAKQLAEIAQIIALGKPPQEPISVRQEAITQIRAVFYAGLRSRLLPYDLFSELDNEWVKYKPEARYLGRQIATIMENNGINDLDSCRTTMIAIVEFLHIPSELMIVRLPLTGETVWPKQE